MNDTATMNDIGLLLAHGDSGVPVLERGLDAKIPIPEAPPKKRPAADDEHLRSDGADPSDLSLQRWGLVVPRGPEGQRLRQLIAPLIQRREEQQGSKAIVYEVEPGMTAEQTWAWWADVYRSNTHDGRRVHEYERPRYLLALGGPELISWEFQIAAGKEMFLGRLAFPDDAGYEAYVHKVLRHERAQATPAARALFHTVRDDTRATQLGYEDLMSPAVAAAREGARDGVFATQDIVDLGEGSERVSMARFLDATATSTPTLLFTISHGLGGGRWKSVEEQRRFQGAMSFGGRERLSHEEIERGVFLPGGVWFFVACLGAGTPRQSEYYHWLTRLREMGLHRDSLDYVLEALPRSGETPFVARLPQAALANPDGPLSVIAHVDLAWTCSFREERMDAHGNTRHVSRSSRFDDVFRSMVQGTRMGASCCALNTVLHAADGELSTLRNEAERLAVKGVSPAQDPAKQRRRVRLWMTRQDVASYVTLGDPAVRLNVLDPARVRVAAPPAHTTPTIGSATALATGRVQALDRIEEMERYVVQILAEDRTAKQVASKLGLERDEVSAWVDAYRTAGREALKKL